MLIHCGYDPGPADGIYGPKSARALKNFQNDHGLPATGIPDENAYAEIKAASKQSGSGSISEVTKNFAAASSKENEMVLTKTQSQIASAGKANNGTKESGACSVVKAGGTTARTVGETLNAIGEQHKGSFIGSQLSLAGGIYKALGSTIEGGADDMQSGKEVSFYEGNRRAAVAVTGAIGDWASDSHQDKDKIVDAQRVLKKLGYYTGDLDGVMGKGTKEAIRDYRYKKGVHHKWETG